MSYMDAWAPRGEYGPMALTTTSDQLEVSLSVVPCIIRPEAVNRHVAVRHDAVLQEKADKVVHQNPLRPFGVSRTRKEFGMKKVIAVEVVTLTAILYD